MRIQSVICPWVRASVVVWASLWVLAVPLFHVHPEADHRHGDTDHIHGGIVHLAWSPDLDCEFDGHRQADQSEQSAHRGSDNVAQFSHLGDSHAEFSLSLLSDSTDRKSARQFVTQALEVSPAVDSGETGSVRLERNTTPLPPSTLFSHAIVPRAPPLGLV